MEKTSIAEEKFIDRLEAFMNAEGLNANKITVAAGLSNGLIGKTLKKRSSMNSDSIESILYSYPRLNADWLMTGRGGMYLHDIAKDGGDESLITFLLDKNEKLETEVRELLKEKAKLELLLNSDFKRGCV